MTPQRDCAESRPFRPLGSERKHYWLVQRMAKATGVDLVEAMAGQSLTSEDWARMVTHCRGCEWVQGCRHWLDAAEDTPRACPDGCANKARFADLKTAERE
ncbi:DUF6455 family protein [Tropicibacter sp. S64]|uniref:DUF6455 family protein n=1 Tax=Tropicibacter sp. S64 TaxID=3415122 RepID=UPI003C7C6C2D